MKQNSSIPYGMYPREKGSIGIGSIGIGSIGIGSIDIGGLGLTATMLEGGVEQVLRVSRVSDLPLSFLVEGDEKPRQPGAEAKDVSFSLKGKEVSLQEVVDEVKEKDLSEEWEWLRSHLDQVCATRGFSGQEKNLYGALKIFLQEDAERAQEISEKNNFLPVRGEAEMEELFQKIGAGLPQEDRDVLRDFLQDGLRRQADFSMKWLSRSMR